MKAKFYYCDNEIVRNFFQRHDVFFSKQFCEFFANNLEAIFFKETGLKPSTKTSLAGAKQQNSIPFYEQGLISKLNLVLWIMPEYKDNISFCWKTKSGIVVNTSDEVFDETDMECWIEGLKPTEYWKEVATEKKDHPFKVGKLPFELKVFGFGINTQFIMELNDNKDKEAIKINISETIENYNIISESKDRKYGVVHNFQFWDKDHKINVQIDIGSAGIEIIKSLLKCLKKFESIEKVEIDL